MSSFPFLSFISPVLVNWFLRLELGLPWCITHKFFEEETKYRVKTSSRLDVGQRWAIYILTISTLFCICLPIADNGLCIKQASLTGVGCT